METFHLLSRIVSSSAGCALIFALSACVPDKPASRSGDRSGKVSQARIEDEALRAVDFARKAQDAVMASAAWKNEALEEGRFAAIGIALPPNRSLWLYDAAWCREPAPEDPLAIQKETVVVWPTNFEVAGEAESAGRGGQLAQRVGSYLGPKSAGIMESGGVRLSGITEDGAEFYALPSGCAGLGIGEGAPVFLLTTLRKDTGSTESANTSYEVKGCPAGQVGTRVVRQYAHKEDGVEDPSQVYVAPEETYDSVCIPLVTVTPVTPPVIAPVTPPIVTVNPPIIIPPPPPPALPPPPPTGVRWYVSWRIVSNFGGMEGQWAAKNTLLIKPVGIKPVCVHKSPEMCTYNGNNWCGTYLHGERTSAYHHGVVDQIECVTSLTPQP